MKTILSILTLTILTISSTSGINYFINNESGINKITYENDAIPSISKIPNLDYDIISIATFNGSVLASSRFHAPYSKRGLYRSIDNMHFTQTAVQGQMNSMVSTTTGILYLADSDVLYKSTNGGVSFNEIENFQDSVNCVGINSDNVIYVGSRNFLYQSTDGITFNKIYDFGDASVQKIVIAPNNTMYLVVGRGLINYVTKSFDKGYHFTKVPNLQFIEDVAVAQDNKVYISSVSIYQSTDNGNTFAEIPDSNKIVSALTIGPNNVLYFESTDTLWKLNSDNSITKIWSFAEMIHTIKVTPEEIIWVGTERGLFKLWFA